jgi:hypothetical protein
MRQPKYVLVRGLAPAGQPHGKAVGHLEVYGTAVPYCERYVAFRYRPGGESPAAQELARAGARTRRSDEYGRHGLTETRASWLLFAERPRRLGWNDIALAERRRTLVSFLLPRL